MSPTLKGGEAGGRAVRIIDRVLALRPTTRNDAPAALVTTLERRHDDVTEMPDRRFADLSRSRRALRFERPVALLSADNTRFITSLRGIGEGQIGSTLFRLTHWPRMSPANSGPTLLRYGRTVSACPTPISSPSRPVH